MITSQNSYSDSFLSYSPLISALISGNFNESEIKLISVHDSSFEEDEHSLMIYEDTPQCIDFIIKNRSSSFTVYLLEATALSIGSGSTCILDYINDNTKILVPWSHRVGEFKLQYPKHQIYFLPLPILTNSSEANLNKDVLIAYSGPLESRLRETYSDLKNVVDVENLVVINLNSNEDLLRRNLEEEGMSGIRTYFPKNVDDIILSMRSSGFVVFPHNTSLRDIHWSYLYCLYYKVPSLLGLRSDLESLPAFAGRYYLGVESISSKFIKTLKDRESQDLLASYIEEIHSLGTFLLELKMIQEA